MVQALGRDPRRFLCPAHLLETAIVVEARKGPAGGRELDLLLHRAQIQLVNLTARMPVRTPSAPECGRYPALSRVDFTAIGK